MTNLHLTDFSCRLVGINNQIDAYSTNYIDELNVPRHSVLCFEFVIPISIEQFKKSGFFAIMHKNSSILSIDLTKNQESTCDIIKPIQKCLKIEMTTLSGAVYFLFKDDKYHKGIDRILFYTSTTEFAHTLMQNTNSIQKK